MRAARVIRPVAEGPEVLRNLDDIAVDTPAREMDFGMRAVAVDRENFWKGASKIPKLCHMMENRNGLVVDATDEPAEQQIVVELLGPLPFRAYHVDRRRQQRSQQPLRRNRRLAMAGVSLAKLRDRFFTAASARSRIARSGCLDR